MHRLEPGLEGLEIELSFPLSHELDFVSARERAADQLCRFIDEFEIEVLDAPHSPFYPLRDREISLRGWNPESGEAGIADYTLSEDDLWESGEECVDACLLVGVKKYSTTGFHVYFDESHIRIYIPAAASFADFVLAIGFISAVGLSDGDSEQLSGKFCDIWPFFVDPQDMETLWKRRADDMLERMRELVEVVGYYDFAGINRAFYADASAVPQSVPERFRVSAFMNMFARAQWTDYLADAGCLLTRKVKQRELSFRLADNSSESVFLMPASLYGLVYDNNVVYVEVDDILPYAYKNPAVIRLDLFQGILRKMPDDKWRSFCSRLPGEHLSNFSRLYLLRRRVGEDKDLFYSLEEWQEIVDALARGKAYVAIPKRESEKGPRPGDRIAVYSDMGKRAGIVCYAMVVLIKAECYIVRPLLVVNPDSEALLLNSRNLPELVDSSLFSDDSSSQTLLTGENAKRLRHTLNLIVEQFSCLPNIIPESGRHCDYALDSEDPLPLEVIAAHPGLVDNENPLHSDRSCRAFHEEELPF